MAERMSDVGWGMWDVGCLPSSHPASHIPHRLPSNHSAPLPSPAPTHPLMLSVSGCRGIVGETMTPEVAARFGTVVGGYFAERAGSRSDRQPRPLVILGRDGRAGGDILAAAAASGLAAAGCDVLDCGIAPTPTLGV